MRLKFIEKIKESNDTFSLIFKTEEKLKWDPGQYIFLKIPHNDPDSRGIKRHFTISSAPFEEVIRITTKFDFEKGSSFKKALFSLEPGTTIEAFDISGKFVIKDPDKKYVFIAGGIGITPCRSIFMDMVEKKMNPDITLIYGNKNNDIPFKDILNMMEEENDWLNVVYIIEPDIINQDVIKKSVDDLNSSNYYLSGPPKMVKSIENALLEMDVSKKMINKDYFTGYSD